MAACVYIYSIYGHVIKISAGNRIVTFKILKKCHKLKEIIRLLDEKYRMENTLKKRFIWLCVAKQPHTSPDHVTKILFTIPWMLFEGFKTTGLQELYTCSAKVNLKGSIISLEFQRGWKWGEGVD